MEAIQNIMTSCQDIMLRLFLVSFEDEKTRSMMVSVCMCVCHKCIAYVLSVKHRKHGLHKQ